MQKLKNKVNFGKWEKLDGEREYGGKSIQQLEDGSIVLSMVKYVQKLKELDVNMEDRKQTGETTSEQHKTAFRALIGGLLWAARTGVPQTVAPIVYPSQPPADVRWVVVWADASLAQDNEGKSQMAWIVAKADCKMM
eukprot:6121775-Amphidinium_carterae.1